MLEDAQVEEIIKEGSKKETLETFFMPYAPASVSKFFRFMQSHISLVGTGMGGVLFRETRSGLKVLMDKEGYDYSIYKGFISDFENELMKQYNEDSKKEG